MASKKITLNELRRLVKQVINENDDSVSYGFEISEIVDDEIRIYEDNIRKLLNSVGEGIENIDINSSSLYGKGYSPEERFNNEVYVTFHGNAWGGISVEEWVGLKRKLDEFVGRGGFRNFLINPSKNSVSLEFDKEYPMGDY